MFLANFIKDRSQKHYENCDFIKDSNNLFLIFEKKINISILERQLDSSILNSADFILNLKPYFRLSKVVDPNDVNKFLFNEFKPKQNVLNLINRYREDLVVSQKAIDDAVNTIQFQTIPLNNKVEDDDELLAFVNESVKKCNALDRKKSAESAKPKKKPKKSSRSHHGHDH